METKDIRWIQRLNNYKKVLYQLREAVELMEEREPSRLENKGVYSRLNIFMNWHGRL